MKSAYSRAAGALLMMIAAFCMAPAAHAATEAEEATGSSEYWWRDAPNHAALQEALAEYGLDTDLLERDPATALKRTEDWGDPLHWLARSVRIYGQAFANNGVYHIPVTEQHAGGMKRRATGGRSGHFVTRVNADASVLVGAVSGIPEGVSCYVGVISDFSPNTLQEISLPPTGRIAPPSKVGTVVLRCQDLNEDLPNAGADVAIRVETTSAHSTEMFVFGVVTKASWKTHVSQQNAALGRVFLFNGRTRFLVPKARAVAAADIDIMNLMREHLQITLSYDRINGYGGPSGDVLDLAPTDLVSANYGECCWAAGSFGNIGIGGKDYPLSTTSWLDWHEYGHLYQTGWDDFAGLSEVTVNLYALAACRDLRDGPPIATCHSNAGLAGVRWDGRTVRTFIDSGVTHDFDGGSGGNAFLSASLFGQLMTSYDGLFAELGRAYRRGYNRGKGPLASYSKEQLRDWFVINTSRLSGEDLRTYYRRWGLGFSAAADAQVAALALPAPGAYDYRFTGTMYIGEGRASISGVKFDHLARNMGLVNTYVNPTKLIFENVEGVTTFHVGLKTESGSYPAVKLTAQRRVARCGWIKVHAGVRCTLDPTVDSTTWRFEYDPAGNTVYRPGRYTGTLELHARDGENESWKGRVIINVELTVK